MSFKRVSVIVNFMFHAICSSHEDMKQPLALGYSQIAIQVSCTDAILFQVHDEENGDELGEMESMKLNGGTENNDSPRSDKNGAAVTYSENGKFTTESEVYIGEPETRIEKL